MTETTDYDARLTATRAMDAIDRHVKDCMEYRSDNKAALKELRMLIRWILAMMIAALAALAWTAIKPANAHDLAQWIQRDPAAFWCCTPGRDCLPVPGRVYWTQSGWSVVGLEGSLRPGARGLFEQRTPDGNPWACSVPGTATLRCLFLDPGLV